MTAKADLPAGVTVFERGWLSSNNVLVAGREQAALVDSGYATHAEQTLSLVRGALGGRPLDLLVNTHLHSDHCGGNALLQREFPSIRTLIPPGEAAAVARWDESALTYASTGQLCERFRFDALLQPGQLVRMGDLEWEIHAAPGHDPHSVVLFEPASRTLASADALWENGFGIVFPELEGESGFDEVAATLDLIESLQPRIVIPGHGRVFGAGSGAVGVALERARSRLISFVQDPVRHARHAVKVLLKFKLLEAQQMRYGELENWARCMPYFHLLVARYSESGDAVAWLRSLLQDLVKSGAVRIDGDMVLNT
jgi:glyoxylase-like metal-dependent hydrolase (beta-lactamase superfamily II)